MATSFISFLNDLSPLSLDVEKTLSNCIEIYRIEKHDLLIIEEDKDMRMYFLNDGYVRCFYTDHYRERTLWFRGPGELLIAGRGFYDQNGAADNIEVQKAGQVASLSYEALDAITTGYPEFEKCRRVLAEYMFKASVELDAERRSMSYGDRFNKLIRRYPDLLDHVKATDVADHLDISLKQLAELLLRTLN